jgi:hypothetical protein
MARGLRAEFNVIGDEVRATAVSDNCKHSIDWCLKQLPALYAQYGETNESRFGDEIAALIKAVIKELQKENPSCPKARKLIDGLGERVGRLHERLGIPSLNIGLPSVLLPGPPQVAVTQSRPLESALASLLQARSPVVTSLKRKPSQKRHPSLGLYATSRAKKRHPSLGLNATSRAKA